jgi:hypothetical protein
MRFEWFSGVCLSELVANTTGLQKYWNFRDEITVLDGLLYKSQRIMVPKTLQREMLVKLHESHLPLNSIKSAPNFVHGRDGIS